MVHHLRTAVSDGLARVRTRNGVVLLAALLLASLLQAGLVQAVSATYLPLSPTLPAPASAPAAPGSRAPPFVALPAALLASLAGGLLTVPVRVVAIRTLASDETDRVPVEFVFHRLGRATLHSVLASWLVLAATVAAGVVALVVGVLGVGLLVAAAPAAVVDALPRGPLVVGVVLALLVPSALLGAALLFAGPEVAVRDRGVLGALRGSWRLTRGVRLRLLLLALAPLLARLAVSSVAFERLPAAAASGAAAVAGALVGFLALAVVARAYRQRLRAVGGAPRPDRPGA
jgi:hypothetical protein